VDINSMKTLRLIERYMRLLEQDDAEVEKVDVVETEPEPVDPGQQAIAELIAAAFAYPPTNDDSATIEEIEELIVGTHNQAPNTSDTNPRELIISIIGKLPEKLQKIYTVGPAEGANPYITPESEIPLSQLLANAFKYRPTTHEGLIATAVVNQYLGPGIEDEDRDPQKVIETIQRLLEFTDEPLEDELLAMNLDEK
tara:strand:+ start:222 stop:812 length:591 start_codon:yes stop_codon:yes gene_type:complete